MTGVRYSLWDTWWVPLPLTRITKVFRFADHANLKPLPGVFCKRLGTKPGALQPAATAARSWLLRVHRDPALSPTPHPRRHNDATRSDTAKVRDTQSRTYPPSLSSTTLRGTISYSASKRTAITKHSSHQRCLYPTHPKECSNPPDRRSRTTCRPGCS